MSTLLLVLVLIALVTLGILMGVRTTKEYFVSVSGSGSKSSTAAAGSNVPAASGSGSALLGGAAPIAGSSAYALPPGISSYSAVGIGDASSINNLTDMTILENAFLAYIRGQRKPAVPPSTPPDANEKAIIAMARSTNKTVSTKIASGDTSVTNPNELVIEEINAIIAIRGQMGEGDLTKQEYAKLVKMRKDFAASTASRYSGSSGSGSGSSGSAIQRDSSLQEATDASQPPMDDVNQRSLGSAGYTPKFSAILDDQGTIIQDRNYRDGGGLMQGKNYRDGGGLMQGTNYRDGGGLMQGTNYRHQPRRPSVDPEAALLQEQIDLLAMQQIRMERQMQQSCPDMSKYIKMDEVPCYNCTLP